MTPFLPLGIHLHIHALKGSSKASLKVHHRETLSQIYCMVVAGCEINVRSYTPCRAPVAPTHTHTHTYTVHYTSQTACSHYIRNCCTVHKPIVRCKDCVNLLLCRQGLQIAFKFRACAFQVVERQKREGDIWTRQTFFYRVLERCCLAL